MVTLLAAGCSSQPAATSAVPVMTARKADPEPALKGRQTAWLLPEGVHARSGYGVRTNASYAVFGVGPADPRGGDAEIGPGDQAQFAVLDLKTGKLVVRPVEERGRKGDVAALADRGGESWLVQVTSWPQPASDCPQTPEYCWSWAISASRLPDGAPRPLMEATAPGPQFFLPAPVTDGSTVYWLDTSSDPHGGSSRLTSWTPGSSAPRVIARVPFGRLSIDSGAAWIGVDRGRTAGLHRIDLATGAVRDLPLPAGASQAVVLGGKVAYAVRAPETDATPRGAVQVLVADASAPADHPRRVYRDTDVYTLNWGAPPSLVVSSAKGYRLVDEGRVVPLPLDLLSGVHNDEGSASMVVQRPEGQVVVVSR